MAIGNLNFISPLKVVAIDLKRNPVEYGSFETGKICGTSLTRKPLEKKEPKGKRYTLPDNLETEPTLYKWAYQIEQVLYTRNEVLKQKADLLNDYSETTNIVNLYKNVWKLKKLTYFYWNNLNNLPMDLINTLIYSPEEPKKRNTWEERPIKRLSPRTKSKIESKLLQWFAGVTEKYKASPERVNFYFWTFTVTTPNFSHEQTVKAWANFLNILKQKNRSNNHPMNYLWVVELQDRKKDKGIADNYYNMFKKGGKNEFHYKQQYEKFTNRALNATNNLHYHMVIDKRLELKEVQRLWLDALEYVGASRYTSTGTLAEPVDCEKIDNNAQSVSQYLSKYVSKSDAELKCQLWHCSRPISKLATSMADCYIQLDKIKAHYEAIAQRSFILC